MLGPSTLRRIAWLTVMIFTGSVAATDYLAAQENRLETARRLVGEGSYRQAVTLLESCAGDLEARSVSGSALAEVYLLRARARFADGDSEGCDADLRRMFQACPEFSVRDADQGLQERVSRIQTEASAQPKPEDSTPNIAQEKSQPQKPAKKKRFPWKLVAAVVVAGALVYFLFLKKSKCLLSVGVGEGVNGSPASGKVKYKKGTRISYAYTLQGDYKNLTVRLNGQPVSASGGFSLDRDSTLEASAEKKSVYNLTVNRNTGVDGVPASGTYSHSEGTVVDYAYFPLSGYSGLTVLLDGVAVPASGSVTMNGHHTLTASATQLFTLTVALGTGTTGTPAASADFSPGTVVNYSYALLSGYTQLTVRLDGIAVPASGSVTMNGHHALTTSADRFARVQVGSEPAGRVFVDGLDQGKNTPCILSLTAGEHELKVVKAGYGEARKTLTLSLNKAYSLQATLAPYAYRLSAAWGSFGNGSSQFNYPQGVAVDHAGDVYVADTDNNRILKYSSTGDYKLRIGTAGQFYYPHALTVDGSGNIYVCDTYHHRIVKLSSTGLPIAQWGSLGSGTNQLDMPRGIEVDSQGRVYVADSNNHRVIQFTSTGQYITHWGSKGSGRTEFNDPRGIAIDRNGNLFIADKDNNRIVKILASGAFVSWGGPGQVQAPHDLAVGPDGNIFVTDTDADRIRVFSSLGTLKEIWDAAVATFSHPRGIAAGPDGSVFVADTSNHRIQKFTLQPANDGSWEVVITDAAPPAGAVTPVSRAVGGKGISRQAVE